MNENFIKVSKKLIFKKVLLFLCIFSLMISISVLGADLKLRVITKRANVRLKASLNSDILSQVPLGAILESQGKVGNWYKVNLPADESGFVVSGYIYESIVEEVIQKFKEPTIKKESPPVINEERESYIQQKSPVTEKKPIKKYAFRCGLGLSFPTGDWSDDFSMGFGGNGSVIYNVAPKIDLVGCLDFNYFSEKDYDDCSFIRLILSGAGRYNFEGEIAFFIEGGLSLFHDIIRYGSTSESWNNLGIRFGGGVMFSNIEILGIYHIVKIEDENFNMLTFRVSYRF